MVCFSGVSNCITQSTESANQLNINGFSNDLGENLHLTNRITIDFDNKDSHEILICSIVNQFEEEIAYWLKHNVRKMVPNFFKNSYDFVNTWKHITSKVSIFQIVVLLTNLAFYHDLTCLIALNDKNTVSLHAKLRKFLENHETNLTLFCEELRSKSDRAYPKHSLQLQCQFVFLIRYHCDIVKRLLECKISGVDEFEFLALPKYSFEFQAKNVGNSAIFDTTLQNYKRKLDNSTDSDAYTDINSSSEILKYVDKLQSSSDFDITFRCLNYRVPYGYELLPATSSFVFTPLSQRCLFTLANAIGTNVGAMLRGPNNIGKRSTVKATAHLIGKELFTFDCHGVNYELVTQIFQGMASGGFWILFENIQSMDYAIVSTLCQAVSFFFLLAWGVFFLLWEYVF